MNIAPPPSFVFCQTHVKCVPSLKELQPCYLQFYAKSGSNGEEVGHIMLDLRSISSDGAEYKWYPLSRCKYKTHKPQIRLMMSTEDSEEDQQPVILEYFVKS